MRHLAAAASQPWLCQQDFGPLPRDRQHTARRYRGEQTPGNNPQSCPVYQTVEAQGSGHLRLGDQGSVAVRWSVRQVQRPIGEQHLEDIEEQGWRGDRDPSSSPSPGASSPSSSFVRGCGRGRSRPLPRPLSTDALSRHAATRCNASSSSSSSSSSSGKLAGYQATVASLSSILIRALNNRIRTNLSLPIWYRCVSSWADDAWQAVTIVSDNDPRQYRPSDGHLGRSAVAQSPHGSRHFGHRLQLDQFPIIPLADLSAVRDH